MVKKFDECCNGADDIHVDDNHQQAFDDMWDVENLKGDLLQNLPAYPAAWPPSDDPIMWISSQDV